MIDVVTQRFMSQVALSLPMYKRRLVEEKRALDARAASKGLALGGWHISALLKTHEEELRARASESWAALVRIADVNGLASYDGIREDLKRLMDQAIAEFLPDIQESLAAAVARSSSVRGTFTVDVCRREVLQHHHLEIDLYVDGLISMKSSGQPVNSYVINGPVGMVQTGERSTGHVVQHAGSSDIGGALAALEALRKVVRENQELPAQKRAEVLEIADACEQQLSRPEPNKTMLGGMFGILCTTIQTLPAAQPAYQALRAALIPLGLPLP
ncbi:hypothetical protein [Pseudoxanthomonas mexicana]